MADAIAPATPDRHRKGHIPNVGEISQPFGLMNETPTFHSGRNGGFLPFFEFGTPRAKYLASRTVREKQTKVQGEMKMSAFDYAGNRALAAVFAFAVSAVCMAAAIVPASPSGFIV